MKLTATISALIVVILITIAAKPQTKPQALPVKTFLTLRDSTTYIDVVYTVGKGSSLSMADRNVKLFNSFFDYHTVPAKNIAQQSGIIMWQINGKEFLTGNFFLGDSTGYVVFNVKGVEYVNLINANGNTFFKGQMKQ
jgi:hypothetical protein